MILISNVNNKNNNHINDLLIFATNFRNGDSTFIEREWDQSHFLVLFYLLRLKNQASHGYVFGNGNNIVSDAMFNTCLFSSEAKQFLNGTG